MTGNAVLVTEPIPAIRPTDKDTTMHALLNRLLLWHKFALMGLFSFILIATPLILFVNEANKSIDAAEAKVQGLVPSRAVLKVVILLQQHRGLSARALAGNDAAQA